MAAAELVGDLAVLYTELAARPRPEVAWAGKPPSTRERFLDWYAFGEHLLHLAIDAGIAAAATPAPVAVANLRDVVAGTDEAGLLHDLLGALYDGFSYVGYEYGYFYGGQSWPTLCWFRSGVVFLAELAGIALDFQDIEANMALYGFELWEEVAPPERMPQSHWWWFRQEP